MIFYLLSKTTYAGADNYLFWKFTCHLCFSKGVIFSLNAVFYNGLSKQEILFTAKYQTDRKRNSAQIMSKSS